MIILDIRSGQEHHAALFTSEQVEGLRQRFRQEKPDYTRLARELGVSRMTIYRLLKRITYRD